MREGGLKKNEREVAMSDVGGGGSCFVEENLNSYGKCELHSSMTNYAILIP